MPDPQEDVRKVYEELCTSYRAIDDFRAKLLGFLPLASAGGIFFLIRPVGDGALSDETKALLWAVGAFGFFVTLGLFFYELYGVKKCGALIKAGKNLEKKLGVAAQEGGQFTARPREVAEVINEPFAAGVIYPAVLAAWTYLALADPELPNARWWAIGFAIGVFVIGFAVALYFNLKLGIEDGIRLVSDIVEEDPVTFGDVWEYFTSEKANKEIRKKFEMGDKDLVGIRRKWTYIRSMTMEDIHFWNVMRGKRISDKTHGEVVETLIDYVKNGNTTLYDLLEKYPNVSRAEAEDYLEVALKNIEYGLILDDVLEKYPTVSREQAVDYLEGKTSSRAK